MHFYHLLLWQCFFYEAQHIDCGVAAKSPPAMNECLFLINQDWIWIENYGSLLISILQFCASGLQIQVILQQDQKFHEVY